MDLDSKVIELEDQLKLLKNQIMETLLDVRECFLNHQNPFSNIKVSSNSMAEQKVQRVRVEASGTVVALPTRNMGNDMLTELGSDGDILPMETMEYDDGSQLGSMVETPEFNPFQATGTEEGLPDLSAVQAEDDELGNTIEEPEALSEPVEDELQGLDKPAGMAEIEAPEASAEDDSGEPAGIDEPTGLAAIDEPEALSEPAVLLPGIRRPVSLPFHAASKSRFPAGSARSKASENSRA